MGIAHYAALAVGHALRRVHAGADKLAARKVAGHLPATLELRSPDFGAGEPLPLHCTSEGRGEPPRLVWDPLPEACESAVLIVEDPDAPFPQPFVHWLVYGIAPDAQGLTLPLPNEVREGQNSTLNTGFTPAAPPPGHGRHRYHFQLFALDTAEQLPPDTGRAALLAHMRDHVLAWGELSGTYQRT